MKKEILEALAAKWDERSQKWATDEYEEGSEAKSLADKARREVLASCASDLRQIMGLLG